MDKPENNWHILLYNLELCDSPIIISAGLTLRSIECPLSIFDLAAAGSVGFREWATIEPFVYKCRSEIISAADAASIPGYDTLGRAYLLSCLLNLNNFSAHLCLACSNYSWNIIAGHQKRTKDQFSDQLAKEGLDAAIFTPARSLPPFRGGLLDYNINFMFPKKNQKSIVTVDDAKWLAENYDRFNLMSANSDKFRLGLEASIDWRYSKHSRAAIARIWCGIEAILGIKQELSYRLASYLAALLCERGQNRRKKYNGIRKLYNSRSKAVHGDKITEEALDIALSESFDLLRDLLVYCAQKGKIASEEDIEIALFE